jgi:hypothetical protein
LAWQSDLNGLPGIHFDTADASGEIWMEIERLRPAKPPAPSAALIPWVLFSDNPTSEPSHRETLPNPEVPETPLVFDEIPSLVSAFETYVDGPWKKWVETEKPRRASIGIYDKLFNLLQKVETEGAETALELVWGIGVAVWNKDGKRARYPLLSRLVEIDPISPDMALRVPWLCAFVHGKCRRYSKQTSMLRLTTPVCLRSKKHRELFLKIQMPT